MSEYGLRNLNSDVFREHAQSRVRRFQKKPVEIKAMRFFEGYRDEAMAWSGAKDGGYRKLIIETLEGDMTVYEGDWIIQGVEGEFYPCKPDIFEKTYQRVYEGSGNCDGGKPK